MIPAAEILGNHVAKTLQDLHQQIEAAKLITQALLKHVGAPALCKGCGAQILFVRHTASSGKLTPYDPDGLNHFGTCPKAAQFKRPKTKEATQHAG